MNKIDFIFVGPGKAGTSWIYKNLLSHTSVSLSKSKETVFFERYFEKGYNFYHSFFDFSQDQKIYGEISNTYIFDKLVPKRIFEYNKKVKIIITLRNPIDRTFSHYLYMVRTGILKCSFIEALKVRPDLIERGRYNDLINEYYKYFPPNQILFLFFEDLKSDPEAYMGKIYKFLNVKYAVNDNLVNQKILSAAKPRNYVIAKLASKASGSLRDWGFAGLLSKLKFNKKINQLLYKEYTSDSKPKISNEEKDFLKSQFATDVNHLSGKVGRDLLSLWKF